MFRRALPLSLVLLAACAATTRPDGGTGLLSAGAPAPTVAAPDQDGKTRTIAEAAGKYLVVYFYPKDGTPGCTEEACAFRDVWSRYEKSGVMIYGVSADDVASHKEFATEKKIPFPLIADTAGTWATAFGVGSTLGFMERVSFLVAPDGKIAMTYPSVDPGVHAAEILADVEKLESSRVR